jgi:alpha-N-arabinofuranosidase
MFGEGIEEIYDLSDALVVAGLLNVMHRNCTTVTLANLAQMVNVIAPIITSPEDLFLQTIYHPFKLYRDHCLDVALDAFVESPTFSTKIFCEGHTLGDDKPWETAPYIDVSATMDKDATQLALAVINRHEDEALEVEISLGDFNPEKKAAVYEINGPYPKAINSFEEPENVKITEKEFTGAASEFTYKFPAHSITLLKFRRA